MIPPVYIASIIDKFLCHNNLYNTRSIFRNEASFLFSDPSIGNQVENNVLSLEDILNEYIDLKLEKERMDQERESVLQEKVRIGILLRSVHSLVNIYNAFYSQRTSSFNVPDVSILIPVTDMQSTHNTSSLVNNTSSLVNTNVNIQNFPTHMISDASQNIPAHMISDASDMKRKHIEAPKNPPLPKRPRGRPPSNKKQVHGQNTWVQSSKEASSCPMKQIAREEDIHSIPPIEGFIDKNKEKESEKNDVGIGLNSDACNIRESLDQRLSQEVSFLPPESENQDIHLSYLDDLLFNETPQGIHHEDNLSQWCNSIHE